MSEKSLNVKGTILFCLFLFGLINLFPLLPTKAQEPTINNYLNLESSSNFFFYGQTLNLSLSSSYDDVRIEIEDLNQKNVYDKLWKGNESRNILIDKSFDYGDYCIKGSVEDVKTILFFSVVNIQDWNIIPSFPHVTRHKTINYSLTDNFVLHSIHGSEELLINFSFLGGLKKEYDPQTEFFYNDQATKIDFHRENVNVSVLIMYIHEGCKIISNGTIPETKIFEIDLSLNHGLVELPALNQIRKGSIIFDWSDMVRYDIPFEYDSQDKALRIVVPSIFWIDPIVKTAYYESGDFSEYTATLTNGVGSYIIINDTVQYNGSYCQESYAGLGGYAFARWNGLPADVDDEIFIRLYFKMDYLPTLNGSDVQLCEVRDSAWNSIFFLGIKNDSGTMKAWAYRNFLAPKEFIGDSITIQSDQDYYFEARVVRSDASGILQIWFNDENNLVMNETGIDTNTGNPYDKVDVGISHGNEYLRIFFDDVIVSDSKIGHDNSSPINNSVEISNIELNNECYIGETFYLFVASVTDIDQNLKNLTISFSDGTYNMNFTFHVDTGLFTRDSGYQISELKIDECSNSTIGNNYIASFPVRFKDSIDPTDDVDVYLYSIDTEDAEDGFENINNNYFDIVYSEIDLIEFSSGTMIFFLCILIIVSALLGLKWGIVGWVGFIFSLGLLVPNILDPSTNPVLHPLMYWTIFISLALTLLSTAKRFRD